jgi:outer membrane biosynthesis protein TonB
MFKTLKDKITLSGTIVLSIGVALLVFTFASTYGFLTQSLSILASSDLVQTFGEALAPLISTCIRVMYLGVMAWIGSLLTIRGVTIISQTRQTLATNMPEKTTAKEEPQPAPQVKEEVKIEKPQEQTEKPKKPQEETKVPEAKPYEPEIVVLTPEKPPQTSQEQQNQTKEK